jgi:NADH-quinone oxidoreductase subunit D
MSDYRSSRVNTNSFILNFGPQHPAAHGILKISLSLSGEIINRADLQFGLLHRGSEKLCESRSFVQAVPYVDRMDYVANLFQENAIVSSVESLESGKRPEILFLQIRLVFDELSRVLNHLLTMSAICLDLGAMGPIF